MGKYQIIFTALAFCLLFSAAASAQTSAFTYQGKLTDAGTPATGQYDFTFKLYDSTGNQVGSDVTVGDVPVTTGVFTVNLNFGASAFTSGAANSLEIAVRPGTSTGAYTTLAPRQPITSSPYAVQTIRATNAAVADNALNLGGTAANQFVQTNDARLTNDRNPLPNSPSYVQNTTTPQPSVNLNIGGNGTVGGTLTGNVVNAATQFNIGGNRFLGVSGNGSLFAGINAGSSNVGQSNSFFGTNAGQSNTFGGANSMFGKDAGKNNVNGAENSFFGFESGKSNTSGGANSFFGSQTGLSNTTGDVNAFFGAGAGRSNTIGRANSFFGLAAGLFNTTGADNTFIGRDSGRGNATGGQNVFLGADTGSLNWTGSGNTLLGFSANVGANNLTNATAIGYNTSVSQSDSLVLGNGVNVGIGTTAPQQKLHVDGDEILSTGIGAGFKFRDRGSTSFADDWVWYSDSNIARFFRAGVGNLMAVKTNGNIGIGTNNPNSKLEVRGGNIFIANPNSLIITSPNGACWFITVSNAGVLSTLSATCP